eukprot:TRINITY_DN3146_c0_g1_i3.p1 TRINITY_DN3146_c0_g1~~TRINITY_DN3146_c0_g1_i3.p1  ORF type:complete len:604 (+),score=185.96 TRINITY_DN3146_c0_g1_i3:781-2592(+)
MGELIDGQPLFPGESEIDQLYIIQKVSGPLITEHLEMFLRNPRFVGLKFPDMSKPETLQRKYLGKLSKRALSLMNGLLQMDPKKRLTAEECLEHPYFEGLRERDKPVERGLPRVQKQTKTTTTTGSSSKTSKQSKTHGSSNANSSSNSSNSGSSSNNMNVNVSVSGNASTSNSGGSTTPKENVSSADFHESATAMASTRNQWGSSRHWANENIENKRVNTNNQLGMSVALSGASSEESAHHHHHHVGTTSVSNASGSGNGSGNTGTTTGKSGKSRKKNRSRGGKRKHKKHRDKASGGEEDSGDGHSGRNSRSDKRKSAKRRSGKTSTQIGGAGYYIAANERGNNSNHSGVTSGNGSTNGPLTELNLDDRGSRPSSRNTSSRNGGTILRSNLTTRTPSPAANASSGGEQSGYHRMTNGNGSAISIEELIDLKPRGSGSGTGGGTGNAGGTTSRKHSKKKKQHHGQSKAGGYYQSSSSNSGTSVAGAGRLGNSKYNSTGYDTFGTSKPPMYTHNFYAAGGSVGGGGNGSGSGNEVGNLPKLGRGKQVPSGLRFGDDESSAGASSASSFVMQEQRSTELSDGNSSDPEYFRKSEFFVPDIPGFGWS